MFEVRIDEPDYAVLSSKTDSNSDSDRVNRYGKPIQLIEHGNGSSLKINHEDEIGTNPNRNKQHGFHFTADNCIGCHACEAACSEKNDLPDHIAFRSVGYVEGGTFPDYTRMNISMACNHCDDPVCLKGCPTRAYTKHPEYGAVIQDPDICFGCGYCTWVCPYNAPQLDPVAGQVEKCNMCVDRLEVGLKPACVSACVGNALDFGVMENIPDNRDQIETRIPGFPDPSISNPNIRFQQIKSMPREVTRTDATPIKYKKDDEEAFYKPIVDKKEGKAAFWNLSRLSSRENPLVIFTLSVQAAIGLFGVINIGDWFGFSVVVSAKSSVLYLPAVMLSISLAGVGLLMSTTHIGKPFRFYRGFNNLRHSPVCREGLGVLLFMVFSGCHMLCLLPSQQWMPESMTFGFAHSEGLLLAADAFGVLGFFAGSVGLYYMIQCYRIPARPFWNHWSTGTHFAGNALSLGSLLFATIFGSGFFIMEYNWQELVAAAALVMCLGTLLEAIGFIVQAKELNVAEHEGGASHYIQSTSFGKTYFLRNVLLALVVIVAAVLAADILSIAASLIGLIFVAICLLLTSIIGRSLFYVLVIPTTMPGAFFWKNKAFEEHARDIGLDRNPAFGIAPLNH